MKCLEMFLDLMGILLARIPKKVFGDRRRVVVLAWAVVALIFTKTVNLNSWITVVISNAKFARSRERRFSRWLHNSKVDPHAYYKPLLQDAIADWPEDEEYFVALDTSDLGNGYILIRASLIYRGRAIPVSWRVIKHGSTSVSFQQYKPVLKEFLKILPKEAKIVLLADRGFVHKKLVKFCVKNGVHFRIRVKSNTLVKLSNGTFVSAGDLFPPEGEAHFYTDVLVLAEEIGSVNLAVANAKDSKDPWIIITDEEANVTTLDDYALRFDIEENFLDDKSNGFDVESSRLNDAKALERLFLVIAVATLYFTTVGVGVVNLKMRRWVDTHWDRGSSYFKIGWRWLQQQFECGWPKINWFWLDPSPDPEPAIASRKKESAKAKRKWIVSCPVPP